MGLVAEHLQRFREGCRDEPFCALVHSSHEIIPELIAAFGNEPDGEVRAFLAEVIWQHRHPSAIPFLGLALQDADPRVWKQALDGLVTLASEAAIHELRCAGNRQFPNPHQAAEFRGWLEEAIAQAESDRTDCGGRIGSDANAMHLKTGDVEFDLKTLGYAHTTGWLRIHVSVRHPKATWRTAGAILLPDDLRALGEWLCKVSAGDMTQRQISFTEPNLSFEILPTAGKPESLRLNLSYETAPPFMQGEERYEGFAIDFPLAEIDLQAAREAVLLQVKVFPERKER